MNELTLFHPNQIVQNLMLARVYLSFVFFILPAFCKIVANDQVLSQMGYLMLCLTATEAEYGAAAHCPCVCTASANTMFAVVLFWRYSFKASVSTFQIPCVDFHFPSLSRLRSSIYLPCSVVTFPVESFILNS